MMLIGLVGKPSVGKSSFFKAMTLVEVEIANYPFTTIKPNHGIGHVRIACVDTDFSTQCNPRTGFCLDHKRFLPVELLDVAGIVEGASEGEGMGNQFLDDLNQADALIHVIDLSGSTNEKGEPVTAGSYDPIQDVLFLEEELDLWYLRLLNKGWDKFARQVKQENANIYKAIAKQLSGLRVTEDIAKEVVKELQFSEVIESWTAQDLRSLASRLREITKPMIIAANKADIGVAKENLKKLQERFPEKIIIPCSAESELALKGAAKKELIHYVPGDSDFKELGKLTDTQVQALGFIRKNILQQYGNTGVQTVLDAVVFDVLKYIAIYPGGANKLEDKDGNILPDCFLMKDGSTALDFAFKLHTDIGNAFIRAIDVHTKRTVGKEHLLKHRDVMEIVVRK
ncbi:redox-regulated ATPase YchF [Candidatus Woesearchaeota archaeon]|nr:redox-regulated ATPase YchF [Candidatus Woesearchaeota archaeon]